MNELILKLVSNLLYSELGTSVGNNSLLSNGKALAKKLHCQTIECLAEAETEGAFSVAGRLSLTAALLLFKQSSCVTKCRNEGRDHGNQWL